MAWHNRGLALQAVEKQDEAIASFEQALRLNPDDAEAHFDLGIALQAQRKLDDAVIHYQRVLRLEPGYTAGYVNLGSVLQVQGKLNEALACYDEALRRNPNYFEAYNNRGLVQKAQGRLVEAVASFDQALRLQPQDAEILSNRGVALQMQGKLDEAIASYEEAFRLHPTFEAGSNLGVARVTNAQVDEGIELFKKAIELNRHNSTPYYNLGELVAQKRYVFTPGEVEAMEALRQDTRLPPHDLAQLHFALAAHCDSLQQYDEAFGHYRHANEWRRKDFDGAGRTYRADQHRQRVDAMIQFFDPAFFDQFKGFGSAVTLPVFVLGMPRSGTTLVEQILASHPRVFGAGELTDFEVIEARMPFLLNSRQAFPRCLGDMSRQRADAIAAQYLGRLRQRAGDGADRIVDKMPDNFERLGLIAALLPQATIIHCKRDARDVCLSCYRQNFRALNFTTSLEDIGFYYRDYDRLMKHWHQVLPVAIHDVQYEELVRAPENTCRQLVAACGLEWDDRCLAFHETKRPVQTASKLQVRQPIYASSVARWKRYESHLSSLLAILEPLQNRE